MTLEAGLAVLEEIIRLKALANSLVAMAKEFEGNLDDNQVEEIGKMILEITTTLQEKLEEWEPAKKAKAA